MAYKIVNDDSLTSVANAIRVQGSISGTLEFPDGFVSAIQNLSPSPTLQTKSVTYTPSDSAVTDTVTADSGYDGLDEVDVTVNAVPEADFGASVGLQFYTEGGVEKCEVSGGGYAETAGWIDEGSVLTREVHPAIASGTTITPTTSSQTIGGYKTVMEGAVTINPIPSQYKDTTDATATADKILQGYTAYANGQKLVGTASGGITPSGTMSITSNGIYDIVSFASVDVNVSGGGGGDHDVEDGMVTRALSEYSNSRVTTIGEYAFAACSNLTTANFPNVVSIYASAFQSCSGLTTISIPQATVISNNAFANCSSLTTANFPNVTNVGSYAFYNCSSLTAVSFPNATSINEYAFCGCNKLNTLNIPNAITIGNAAFQKCRSLTTASLPKITSILGTAFRSCSILTSVYILASSIVSLESVLAFTSTPMWLSSYTGSWGSIYVPASLVDSYKSAKNWSAYAERITAYTE